MHFLGIGEIIFSSPNVKEIKTNSSQQRPTEGAAKKKE